MKNYYLTMNTDELENIATHANLKKEKDYQNLHR